MSLLEGYVLTKEAAEMLGVAAHHVVSLCQEGKLESYKVGWQWFIKEESIRNYVPGPQGFAAHPRRKKSTAEEIREILRDISEEEANT